ncbi:MAG: TetR/AcrR family transcriptional regulator [Piscirickettsiaceae bacterium]|nr:TetR/AcrR family transcriptional regulator [Piscirickettsiaceae bacterium]
MTDIDTRSRILAATEIRFSQYGYTKTTMAEIARDCGMSAANIYRHFNNKLDIGAALAQQCLFEKELELKCIVTDESTTSAIKLQKFIQYLLHYTYNYFDESPRISELIDAMTIQRPEVIKAHRYSSLVLLRQLLEQGRNNGEFSFENIDETSEAINVAITAFYLPSVMPMFSLEEFEHKAKIVFELLLRSIAVR